ncbi:hypothetical protein Mp_4g21910 [Marchantia polymorpha subsp. ruderalis]|uniref:Uncharacterized protein n=2 Tax=Marchantia polymorpha TaxID=3197 RepID=A0AAF6BCG3_MARPO|nr:hypothetical protein MARPO_0090s0031 [Marchantia polymorpha]BBN09697.1 hypothetical protein Mp_4g21910 [Marchantia polymorpha subsp. ruderalis]|eukprot:PTQ33290.1 hypothetical protein MARPO_0090s0031 [Marchantia polymorpha]
MAVNEINDICGLRFQVRVGNIMDFSSSFNGYGFWQKKLEGQNSTEHMFSYDEDQLKTSMTKQMSLLELKAGKEGKWKGKLCTRALI